MIIYTNEGNPLGLKLVLAAKFAKKNLQVKVVTLSGKEVIMNWWDRFFWQILKLNVCTEVSIENYTKYDFKG